MRDVLHTLAYSFVDNDRLFLRPTVRGRGVNGSIEGGEHASCLTLTLSLNHARPQHLQFQEGTPSHGNLSLLTHNYSITHFLPSRVGRAKTSTTSGDVLLVNLQKKPTSPAHKNRSSSSVGSRSVSFVPIMATLSMREHSSVGTYLPLFPTCVHGAGKRKVIRRS